MNELLVIGLVVAGAYLLSQGGMPGVTGAGVLGPGGQPVGRPGAGARPGGGGGGAIGPAAGLLAPVTKAGQDLFRRATGQSPPIPPRADATAGLIPVTADTLPTMYLDVPLHLYTEAQISALAAQAGTTPTHLLDVAASMGASPADAAAVMQGAAGTAEAGAEAAVVGAQGAAYVGWAIPIAMAVAVGAMVLRAAFTRRGSYGESKGRAVAAVGRLGMAEAFRIANAVLDNLLATGRPPAAFTQDTAIQTGYVFVSWYDNADSFKDAFQGQAGGLEAYEALMVKVRAYYGRIAEMQGWWTQVLNFVQQGDQTWGRVAVPQAYIEEIGRQLPPPAWLQGWQDFQELISLGYVRMLDFIRQTIQNERIAAMTAGEGGNA